MNDSSVRGWRSLKRTLSRAEAGSFLVVVSVVATCTRPRRYAEPSALSTAFAHEFKLHRRGCVCRTPLVTSKPFSTGTTRSQTARRSWLWPTTDRSRSSRPSVPLRARHAPWAGRCAGLVTRSRTRKSLEPLSCHRRTGPRRQRERTEKSVAKRWVVRDLNPGPTD